MAMFGHHGLSPWLRLVDRDRYAADVDRVQALGMTTIATAHSPLIAGDHLAAAFALGVRGLPDVPPPPLPDQTVLDAILATVG